MRLAQPNGEKTQHMKGVQKTGLLIWFRLARVYNHQLRKSADHLKKWHLSVSQFDVLAQIGSKEGLTQKQLADRLLVTQGNITQLLDKMAAQGLIAKTKEGRCNYLFLTPKGRELYLEVVPKQEQFQSEQFDALTDDEKHQLLKLLRKLDRQK
jgi:DNA-binding MarR family transcriptional regulator